jgi:isocitrate dehydrogenase
LSVKNYARKHPHKMGAWSGRFQTHVAHMDGGDFYGSENPPLIERRQRQDRIGWQGRQQTC